MSNGPVTEGVRVAGSLVDVLRTQPSTVAMIVISFALLGFTWYEGSSFNAQRKQLIELILEHQRETGAMLARCVEPSQVETIIRQLEVNRSSYNDIVSRQFEMARTNGDSLNKTAGELEKILDYIKKSEKP